MKPIFSAPHFQNEEAAFAYVETRFWPDGQPFCPHCGTIGKAGRITGTRTKSSAKHPEGKPVIGLWKCYACRQQFTVRMGSIFESSHVPLTIWLQAMHLMCCSKKGVSTRQLQRMIGCGLKTAWFLSMRIRESMKETRDLFDIPMGGSGQTVEGDETFIGRKSTSRAFEPPAPKLAVTSLVQRDGKVRSFHVPNVTSTSLQPIILKHVHVDSRYVTDTGFVAVGLGSRFASHETVNHSKYEYVRGDVYTNTIEGYFSILKRGIYGIYQHVSEAHLQRYLTEFDFRYSHRAKLGVDDAQRADLALKGAQGRRLTYRTVGAERPTGPTA